MATKGSEIREKYGPHIGWKQLQEILVDRACVRYPCDIVFDSAPLLEKEFAHPVARGEDPESGYTLYVHPFFSTQLPEAVALVLYQLVLVNYGSFASAADAEAFGAAVLGMDPEDYYRKICALADAI